VGARPQSAEGRCGRPHSGPDYTDDRYFTDASRRCRATVTRRCSSGCSTTRTSRSSLVSSSRRRWRRAPPTCLHGAIDAYFGYRFGKLPYRSLRFEHEHLPDTPRFQPVGRSTTRTTHAYTRITEFKHLTGQQHPGPRSCASTRSGRGPLLPDTD